MENQNATQFVDIDIAGYTYCIACDNDSKQSLLESVAFFNQKISQIIQEIGEAPKKNSSPIRLIITATLQIISDFLLTQQVLQQLLEQNDIKDNIANNIYNKLNKLFVVESENNYNNENNEEKLNKISENKN